ncbi:MAG: hypothetical protein COB02_01285 [Candidatus Cloacimonadota bacterium]|nr:MAG: hypothetical protein COB02_01285 [Candidatus Cloacimonadota bacterium]
MELSDFLKVWINDIENNLFKNFEYESMDYEESPIFTFKLMGDEVIFDTLWKVDTFDYPIGLNKVKLFESIKLFIKNLESKLNEKTCV